MSTALAGPRSFDLTTESGCLAWIERSRLGTVSDYFVEWNGKPICSIKVGYKRVIALAGLLGKITPHTLRHTAATWPGEENDNAVGQAVMNVLKAVAQELECFVLGIDHFGKDLLAGTRGASSKESSSDVVLACLGKKELSGSVTNTRWVHGQGAEVLWGVNDEAVLVLMKSKPLTSSGE